VRQLLSRITLRPRSAARYGLPRERSTSDLASRPVSLAAYNAFLDDRMNRRTVLDQAPLRRGQMIECRIDRYERNFKNFLSVALVDIELPMARPQFPEFMSSNTTSHA
jgi:hypothetical protein